MKIPRDCKYSTHTLQTENKGPENTVHKYGILYSSSTKPVRQGMRDWEGRVKKNE